MGSRAMAFRGVAGQPIDQGVCDSPQSFRMARTTNGGRIQQILLAFRAVIGQHAGLLGRPPRPLTIIGSTTNPPRFADDSFVLEPHGPGWWILRARAGASIMHQSFETQRARAVSELRRRKCTVASRDAT